MASWLRQAQASGVPEMQRFAAGIGHDDDAVHAARLTPYSNGIVEGHVNRLKFLKRQMYGRAGFQLRKLPAKSMLGVTVRHMNSRWAAAGYAR
ncbi:transposase [Mycetohabitans sp. B5]|uniref:transposase n=1 Tax=Mycetohabitans TaxID=2571159 RepID=UPI0013050609|nr:MULTISPECIES: transposase [Mycetohabitans]MCG1055193.1 transposase [Mycetohabitans sp. B5]